MMIEWNIVIDIGIIYYYCEDIIDWNLLIVLILLILLLLLCVYWLMTESNYCIVYWMTVLLFIWWGICVYCVLWYCYYCYWHCYYIPPDDPWHLLLCYWWPIVIWRVIDYCWLIGHALWLVTYWLVLLLLCGYCQYCVLLVLLVKKLYCCVFVKWPQYQWQKQLCGVTDITSDIVLCVWYYCCDDDIDYYYCVTNDIENYCYYWRDIWLYYWYYYYYC